MQERIIRKLFLGFINIHILHHAKESPVYGKWLMSELKSHGYDVSPGTLYPILNQMEKMGLLVQNNEIVSGKLRKYYQITPLGDSILEEAKDHVKDMYFEIFNIEDNSHAKGNK